MWPTHVSFKDKVIAITGASGALGRELVRELGQQGAKIIAFTTSAQVEFSPEVEVLTWQVGQEYQWADRLATIDILILNHGINVHADRSAAAIQSSLEVNSLSVWRWLELFLAAVSAAKNPGAKEVWINTSEAEVSPAVSPLYEISKRLIGQLITLRRLDAPCVIRKLILGPFKSNLNPIGVMSPRFVAWGIVALAQRNYHQIIVTINPLTYLLFPLKEFLTSLYFRLFSRRSNSLYPPQN